MKRLRAEVDVLFVPISFAPSDREYSELSFPSKLTDYTAVGLPLLIHGPDYCSAVRWARENPGVAEVVIAEPIGALEAALRNLSQPGHRMALAEQALRIGEQFFAHAAGEQVFRNSLFRPH